jgi:hypothetical protein
MRNEGLPFVGFIEPIPIIQTRFMQWKSVKPVTPFGGMTLMK